MENLLWILDGKKPKPAIDYYEWAEWFENNNTILKKTQIEDLEISTIFLGINTHLGNPPLVFETAVFTPDDIDLIRRYATWDEAMADHEALVVKYRGMSKHD